MGCPHATRARRWRADALIAAKKPKPKRGTAFRFMLTEPAAVRIAIARTAPGLRKDKQCRRPTAKLRKSVRKQLGLKGLKQARCTRVTGMGTLVRTGVAGANTVAFSGRLGKKPLTPGRYRAALTATDAGHNASKRATVRFRVVR